MAKKKEANIEVVARLTIKNAQHMTEAERLTVVDWLRDHAKNLAKHPSLYGRRYTGQHYGRKI